ncbi:hypothetical protein SM84_03737 [Klebsiella pneumoniae]|nr:hypothetical protein SM84_03737 [Klebsiella pneumoniae]
MARCARLTTLRNWTLVFRRWRPIPVGAAGEGIGESDVRVNFGGVTFFSGDHLYADNTGMILSEDPLDIE